MDWKEICIDKIINTFPKKKILVVGDLIVDEYVMGEVNRISPEAPIPVLEYNENKREAGGACNVVNNLLGLGADVAVSGVIGNDDAGEWLNHYFSMAGGASADGIVCEKGRPTTLKVRFATKGHQLLRLDYGITKAIKTETKNKIKKYMDNELEKFDAVILSDYKKGVLSDAEFVQYIIKKCNEKDIFVSIDSKSKEISAFENASFVKPNNIELENAVGMKIDDEKSFCEAGEKYLAVSKAKSLIVTRGPKGITVFGGKKMMQTFPAKKVQVYDVCGAGDTVISTITLAMISGIEMESSVNLANYAAGIVISEFGTVPVKSEKLIRSLNEK